MSSYATVMTEMLLFMLRLLRVSLLGPRVFNLFLIMFSLANSFLTSLFSVSTLLVGGTKTVVLVEAILGEEKSYPKLVQSEADF